MMRFNGSYDRLSYFFRCTYEIVNIAYTGFNLSVFSGCYGHFILHPICVLFCMLRIPESLQTCAGPVPYLKTAQGASINSLTVS